MNPKRIAKSVLLVPSAAILFVLWIVRPLVRVQLLVVAFHRFGHLALEPEVFLSLKESGVSPSSTNRQFPKVFRWWSFGPTRLQSNRYLAKKWNEELCVLPSWCVDSLLYAGEKFSWMKLDNPKLSVHGPANALDHASAHLNFSRSELIAGRTSLTEMGIDCDQPFVCLVIRDGGYYASRGEVESSGYEFLNFDSSTFELAAKSLVARGYQVVRMGSGSEKPFGDVITGVFDYALSTHRSEFLDIYLAANCQFAVSTQTGPDAVCLAFRRPVCYIDIVRFSQFFFGSKLAYWNPSQLQRDGRRLTLREIVSGDVVWIKDPDEFARLGIQSKRSAPNEIERLVVGFMDLFENDLTMTPRDHEMSMQAQAIIETGMGERGTETFGRITAHLNPAFLQLHGDWFLN